MFARQALKAQATELGLYRVLGSWLSMLSTHASAELKSEAFTACIKGLLRALLSTPFSDHVLWWINRWGVFRLLVKLRSSEDQSIGEAALALDVSLVTRDLCSSICIHTTCKT